jgi:hypothetical protein
MIQILWLVLIAAAAILAVRLPSWAAGVAGAALLAVGLAWVLVSTLWPSKPNRTSPRCGKAGLVKIRRGEPGARCELCGFEDPALHVAYLDDW